MEKISVIVPTYNNAPWLPQCLDSLLAQTYENLEIIVVDDGSTDGTEAVLEPFLKKHPCIKGIFQENSGVTEARLRGLAAATGEWIGFVDADDVIDPDFYTHLYENATEYHADVSHCGYKELHPDGTLRNHGGSGMIRQQNRLIALQDLLEGRLVEPGLWDKLFRRELFSGLDAWMNRDIRNNEDLLMNYYLFSRANKAVFQDVCLYSYRVREGSASREKLNDNQIFHPILVRQRIIDECGGELKDIAKESLLRCMMYSYARLTMEPLSQFRQQCKTVRKMLVEEKKNFPLLSFRNLLLCYMICYCPWAFRMAFRLYVKAALGGRYE